MSQSSFADLGVSSPVVRALAQRGVDKPFPIQRLVIGDVLAGRDVLAGSPTGSGKTLAFGIPLVERIQRGQGIPGALVLAPTRELAVQIAEELAPLGRARSLRVTAIYGGVSVNRHVGAVRNADILVATPGRLEDLLARRALSLDGIRILVLDEADRMLDQGFQPAIERIVRACPRRRQTLFFSATLDGAPGELARRYTNDAVVAEQRAGEKRGAGRIEHRFRSVPGDDRVAALVSELSEPRDLALVFVRTKRGADRLVKRLGGQRVEAVALHGNKSQNQRTRALAQFTDGKVDVLVATDIAARGLDVDDVSHVINFDPPADRDTYVHRTGRTGRAGREGVSVTLVSPDQRREITRLAGSLGIAHGMGNATGRSRGRR